MYYTEHVYLPDRKYIDMYAIRAACHACAVFHSGWKQEVEQMSGKEINNHNFNWQPHHKFKMSWSRPGYVSLYSATNSTLPRHGVYSETF